MAQIRQPMWCRIGVGEVSGRCRGGVGKVSQIDQIDQDLGFGVIADTLPTPFRHPSDTLPTPPCFDYSFTLITIIRDIFFFPTLKRFF